MAESKEEMLTVALRINQLRCFALESVQLGRSDYGLFQSSLLIWLGQNSLWNGLTVHQTYFLLLSSYINYISLPALQSCIDT